MEQRLEAARDQNDLEQDGEDDEMQRRINRAKLVSWGSVAYGTIHLLLLS